MSTGTLPAPADVPPGPGGPPAGRAFGVARDATGGGPRGPAFDGRAPGDLDDALLDSYSRTVSWVAEKLLPSVAALRVEDQMHRPTGAGSAVLISADGLLVTSAHVVQGSSRGRPPSPPATKHPSR